MQVSSIFLLLHLWMSVKVSSSQTARQCPAIHVDDTVHIDVIRFSCKSRSSVLDGSQELYCDENGEWSGQAPTCKVPLDCGRSPFLTNGDTKETSRSHHRHNERVEYVCQAYHTMEGEPYKTCINGSWVGEMKCLKPCTTDEEAMSSRNIRSRYVSDAKLYSFHHQWISFACTKGRSHDGTINMRQRCEDGVMQLPTCQ